MSGQELIDKIVKELARRKVPPTDAAILSELRAVPDVRPGITTPYTWQTQSSTRTPEGEK